MVLNFLDRTQKRMLALLFISLGVLMITPPGMGLIVDDAFLNIPLAKVIMSYTSFSLFVALLLTYTIIPIFMIWVGAVIYPHSTERILNGTKNKLIHTFHSYKFRLRTDKSTQVTTFVMLIIFYFVFKWYSENITTLMGV